MSCAATICRIVPWNRPQETIKGTAGGNAAEKWGKSSMLTARATYGLGGLLLVNLVLLAAQLALGVSYLPI